jgi:hypothetical protein
MISSAERSAPGGIVVMAGAAQTEQARQAKQAEPVQVESVILTFGASLLSFGGDAIVSSGLLAGRARAERKPDSARRTC